MEKRRSFQYGFRYLALCLLPAGLVVLNLSAGSVRLGAGEVIRALADGWNSGTGDTAWIIVWRIRLPRLTEAAVLGGALSVSGFLLQTYFANPIAGPYVLGISSGARFTVALWMIAALQRGILLDPLELAAAAFIGSFASMGAVLLASSRLRSASSLIVCGVMIGYLCTAATDMVVTFADESSIVNLRGWTVGSFSGADWSTVGVSAAVVLPTVVWAWLLSKPMGAWQMGEAYARSVGVPVRRFRMELIMISGILSGTVAAFAGPVSFVGVAVPHLMKRFFGTARPLILIPACFLGGGSFCLLCDCAARTLFAPADLGISTVTAVIGVPIVIRILLTRRRTEASF